MLYTLKSSHMTVTVNSRGAELWSLMRDGNEYLWQGDPDYWSGRAPVLFPICGRLYGGKYRYAGQEYCLPIHGFAKDSEFAVTAAEDALTCVLEADDATRAVYPFDFRLTVVYRLKNDRTLRVESTVTNTGKGELPFSLGAHPGFRVPLREGERFEDYYLRFAGGTVPRRLVFSDTCFQTGETADFPLIDGDLLLLRHELFDVNPVYTKTRDEAPARYLPGAQVVNSLVADGCIIEGTVEDCVLFRGVRVARGAHIKGSILMQDCDIGEKVELENTILDKNVTMLSGKRLIGEKQYPIVVGKNVTL